MKRILLACALASSPAFGAADLFTTQTNELSQSSFVRNQGATVATDTADVGSTRQIIIAAGHASQPGDMVRFTSVGPNYLLEAHVRSVTTDTITLQRALPADPTPGDTFLVMRLITPSLASDGSTAISGTVSAPNASVGATGGAAPSSATYAGFNNAGTFVGVSNANPLPVSGSFAAATHVYAGSARTDYTGTPVTTGAWVQVIASTAAASTLFAMFDSCGQTLELGTGAAASETRVTLIPPGGFYDQNALNIPASTRVSLRAVSGNCTVGENDLTLFQ